MEFNIKYEKQRKEMMIMKEDYYYYYKSKLNIDLS